MFKKIITGGALLLSLMGVVFFSGCARRAASINVNEEEKIKIAATIFPLYDMVRQIGGEWIEPVLILPPGSSPHTYEVTPAQVKEIQKVKLVFTIGAGVDAWAKNITEAVSGLKTVSMDQYVILKPFAPQNHDEDHGAHETGDEHGDQDPHYWLSPDNAKIMAGQIAKKLAEIDTPHKTYYETRAQDFIVRLMSKDIEWKAKINSLNKKDLVVFHDAWGYFADHFGLDIVAAFEPFPGQAPSPKYLIELQRVIREHDTRALFVEPQLSKEAITALANDLQLKVDVLDPLGGVDGRNSYIDLIDYNVDIIYEALK